MSLDLALTLTLTLALVDLDLALTLLGAAAATAATSTRSKMPQGIPATSNTQARRASHARYTEPNALADLGKVDKAYDKP